MPVKVEYDNKVVHVKSYQDAMMHLWDKGVQNAIIKTEYTVYRIREGDDIWRRTNG